MTGTSDSRCRVMAVDQPPLQFVPRALIAGATLVWAGLCMYCVFDVLRNPMFVPTSWSGVVLFTFVTMLAAFAMTLPSGWMLLLGVLVWNFASRSRRLQFRKQLVQWSITFLAVTAVEIALLCLGD